MAPFSSQCRKFFLLRRFIPIWEGLDAERLQSAQQCAEGVIEAVRERIFWPPAERLPWSDPFEELLFGEAVESVNAAELMG